MDFSNARYHSKGKVGKGDLWMFRCKNRERRGIKCNGWVKVCYRLVNDKPEFDFKKDLVRTRPHDKGCEYFKTNRTLAKQPLCLYRSSHSDLQTQESLGDESVGQQEETSIQETAESDLDDDFNSIDSKVDSVMCKLDNILQAVDRSSIGDQERLVLRRKFKKCQGTLGTLVNSLSSDSCDKDSFDPSDADQIAQANLCVNLYSQLYTSLLSNLFSGPNPRLLSSPSVSDSACNSSIDTKTTSQDPLDDCSQPSNSSNPDSEKPEDAESDSCSFTLAFEDEYKLLGNEQLSESESTFKPKSKKTEPIADDSGAPKEKQPSESKSTDEPNRAKRPNPSQTDDSNAPKEKRPKKPSRKSPKDLSV